MKPPNNPKGVREFLEMVGFYRKFINRFADAARQSSQEKIHSLSGLKNVKQVLST